MIGARPGVGASYPLMNAETEKDERK